MDNRWKSAGEPAHDGGQRGLSSEIRTFQLGEVSLIDVPGPSVPDHELHRVLLREWATCPSGVVIRVNTDGPVDEAMARAITDAAELVQAWPGTPIGVLSASAELHERVTTAPQGQALATGTTMTQVWRGMWSSGVPVNITVELPPTARAARTARDTVTRACLDWGLNTLVAPAALVTGELVSRSVVRGARDLHFTVSRHCARVRLLVRDDVHTSPTDEPRAIDQAFGVRFATSALSELTDSLGEFALDGHHFSWAVMRDQQADRRS